MMIMTTPNSRIMGARIRSLTRSGTSHAMYGQPRLSGDDMNTLQFFFFGVIKELRKLGALLFRDTTVTVDFTELAMGGIT